jgi:hypothetical protein
MKLLRICAPIVILLCLTKSVMAVCCVGSSVDVYPRNTNISTNSLFIIRFTERDFKLKNGINGFVFRAATSSGKTVRLEPLNIYFSGTEGEIVLKPTDNYPLNDSVSIKVFYVGNAKLDSLKEKTFISMVQYHKWKVTVEPDIIAPVWQDTVPSFRTMDGAGSSVGGYQIFFKLYSNDNYFNELKMKKNGFIFSPLYYEITFEGNVFIEEDHTDLSCSINSSICGNNFNFKLNENYTAKIRVMDESGNYSATSKTIVFNTN